MLSDYNAVNRGTFDRVKNAQVLGKKPHRIQNADLSHAVEVCLPSS
jgi:hypothetical protein